MDKQALLEQLKDIHTPESVSWWPLAPLWWVLFAIILAGILFFAWRRWQQYRALAPLRQAFAELSALDPESADFIAKLHRLQRRVAMVCFSGSDSLNSSQQAIAALTGAQWRQFLNQNGDYFSAELLNALHRDLYRKSPTVDVATHSQLKQATHGWLDSLRHHFTTKRRQHA